MANEEVFNKMRQIFEVKAKKAFADFGDVCAALFAFSSPEYTGETRNSWSAKVSDGGRIVEVGNTAPQALYSEYGTKSRFTNTSVTVEGQAITGDPKRIQNRPTGKTALEAITEWCEFKGISDKSKQMAIFLSIMRYGRRPSMPNYGMARALPNAYKILRLRLKDVINGG